MGINPGNPAFALPPAEDSLVRQVKDLERTARENLASVRASFQSTVATLTQLVTDLQAQVDAAIAANSYTASQIDSKIANPPGDVNASGRVTSAQAFRSAGSYAYHVVSGYQSMWINADGTIGVSASTRASKKDTVPLSDIDPLMRLKPMLGRYIWDADDEPLKQFLIAEDVQEAGFGPDVAPLDAGGNPLSVNYSQLVPALIATVQALSARLDAAGL